MSANTRRVGEVGTATTTSTAIEPGTLWDFNDLQSRNITPNRETLRRFQQNLGFPTGFLLGRNSRRWDPAEVLAWVERRKQEGSGTARPDHAIEARIKKAKVKRRAGQ